MFFSVPCIDVSDVQAGALTNAGLLVASLKAGGETVIDVNMVAIITKEGGNLIRTIYSPLE